MKNTTITQLIYDLKKMGHKKQVITKKEIIEMLEDVLHKEEQQIIEAFNEGMKYGNSEFQTFDYPASRYYHWTFIQDK